MHHCQSHSTNYIMSLPICSVRCIGLIRLLVRISLLLVRFRHLNIPGYLIADNSGPVALLEDEIENLLKQMDEFYTTLHGVQVGLVLQKYDGTTLYNSPDKHSDNF